MCPSQGSVAWLAPDTGSCPRHGLTPHTVLSGLLYFGGRTTATLTVITTTTTAKYVSIGNVKMSNHQKEKSKLRFFYKINVKAQSEAGVLGRCSGYSPARLLRLARTRPWLHFAALRCTQPAQPSPCWVRQVGRHDNAHILLKSRSSTTVKENEHEIKAMINQIK